jgi:hypothetical protein
MTKKRPRTLSDALYVSRVDDPNNYHRPKWLAGLEAAEKMADGIRHLEMCGACGNDSLNACEGGRAALGAVAAWEKFISGRS